MGKVKAAEDEFSIRWAEKKGDGWRERIESFADASARDARWRELERATSCVWAMTEGKVSA